MNTFMKAVIWAILSVCFIGLPFSFLAFGSDLQTQQSPLYPYRSTVQISDDFVSGLNTNGTTGALGWIVNGGTSSSIISIANRPGLFQKSTTAAAGTIATLVTAGTASVFDAANPHNILFIARLNTNDANTTIRIGAANAFSVNPPADGIFFEKLDADTNWFCITRAGGVQTRTDSGTAITTSFDTFAYNRNSSGVAFLINNTQVCSQSTNITTAQIAPGLHIVNSAAAAKTVDIDYFRLIISGLTR
jgi:hypothetical protein